MKPHFSWTGTGPRPRHSNGPIQSAIAVLWPAYTNRTKRGNTPGFDSNGLNCCECQSTLSLFEWTPAVFNSSLWFVLAATHWIKTTGFQKVASVHVQVSHSAAWLQWEHSSTLIQADCRKWSCVMGCRCVRRVPEDRAGVLQKFDVFWMSGPKNPKKEMLDIVHQILTFSKRYSFIFFYLVIMWLCIYYAAPALWSVELDEFLLYCIYKRFAGIFF